MDRLAAALGMSKRTLYRYFASKEALVDELLRRKQAAVRDGFEAVLALPGIDFAERAARMMRHAHAESAEVNAIFLHDLRRFLPTLYARLEKFRARMAPAIWERLLRSGIETGAVRADVDPAFVSRLIPVVIQSLLDPDTLERLGLQPHEVLERTFQLLLAGVLTPRGLVDHERHKKEL